MQKIVALWNDRRGVALIEFVIVFPLFLFLVFVGAEFSRYLLIHIKVQKSAYAMASIITQYPPATSARSPGEINLTELTTTLGGNQLAHLLSPYGDNLGNEGMIVTSVRKEAGRTVVKWQVFTAGAIGGVKSIVNQKDSGAISNYAGFVQNQPTTFDALKYPALSAANLATMLDGENMIVVEVFYKYTPLFTQMFGAVGGSFSAFDFAGIAPKTIARQAILTPRNGGDMSCLPGAGSAFLYPGCS
jgi:hypothetical protein